MPSKSADNTSSQNPENSEIAFGQGGWGRLHGRHTVCLTAGVERKDLAGAQAHEVGWALVTHGGHGRK